MKSLRRKSVKRLTSADTGSVTTNSDDYASPSLKQKHLNNDCPHLVSLDFNVVDYEYDEDYQKPKPKRSWFYGWVYRLCFGSEVEKFDDGGDEVDSGPTPRRRRLWSFVGFGCVIILSFYFAFKHSPYSLASSR